MALLENDIKRVQDKLQQLLKQYFLLQRENEKLKELIKKLQIGKDDQLQQIEQLQQQACILKTAAGPMVEADKKQFEKNINQYLKDIDKCIALLSE